MEIGTKVKHIKRVGESSITRHGTVTGHEYLNGILMIRCDIANFGSIADEWISAKELSLDVALNNSNRNYLGDSVYADFNGYALVLTTDNGIGPSNTIYLEPLVIAALRRYLDRLNQKHGINL